MKRVFCFNPSVSTPLIFFRVIVIDKDVGVNAQLTYSVLRANCMNMDGEKVTLEISIDQFGQVKSNSLPDVPVIIDLNVSLEFLADILALFAVPPDVNKFMQWGQINNIDCIISSSAFLDVYS